MKRCSTCRETKPVEDFYRDSSRSDGRTNRCRPCRGAADRARYRANRERILAQVKAYSERNRDQTLARLAAWRAKNRERAAETTHQWRLADPERYRASQRASERRNPEAVRGRRLRSKTGRRARLAAVPIEPIDFQRIWLRDGGICQLCGQPVEKSECEFDHVIPLKLGGVHAERNLQVAHRRCNRKKGARLS